MPKMLEIIVQRPNGENTHLEILVNDGVKVYVGEDESRECLTMVEATETKVSTYAKAINE